MGEWTEVDGKHNSKRVSMRKLTHLIMGNDELCFRRQDNGQDFSFSFSSSGVPAAKKLEALITEFKRLDKNAKLYMHVQVDYYV